jgi:hypothetical protein
VTLILGLTLSAEMIAAALQVEAAAIDIVY